MNSILLRAILVMACVFCGLLGFVVGERLAADEVYANRPDDCQVMASVADADAEQDPSEAGARVNLAMCESAKSEMQASLQALTLQKARLLEDLEFYRGLTEPDNQNARSVRVYTAEISPLSGDRVVLRVVLARAESLATKVQGELQLSIRGMSGSEVSDVLVTDLLIGKSPPTTFAFSNFFEWEAELKLPSGFQPDRLLVGVEIKGRRKPLLKSWLWSELES